MILGSVTKSHVPFGAKGRNGLETSSCCSVWREQYWPRGGWRQTEKSRTLRLELFFQIWRRTLLRGVCYLQGLREKVLGALAPSALLGALCCIRWRQVLFWALRVVPFGAKCTSGRFCPNCLFQRVRAFSGLWKRVNEFLLQTKHYQVVQNARSKGYWKASRERPAKSAEAEKAPLKIEMVVAESTTKVEETTSPEFAAAVRTADRTSLENFTAWYA